MNWSDERYIRLYTRDSLTWTAWGWEARALFCLLLRRVDRSGVLDTGRMDKAQALALMLMAPKEVCAAALAEWLECGTVVERDSALVVPTFMEAQETRQSDRLRQQDVRDRRRTGLINENYDSSRHPASPLVTARHPASPGVTPAVPSRTTPSCALKTSVGSADEVFELKATGPVLEVFEHWKAVMGHPRSVLDSKRKRAVEARLKEGRTVADLKQAVDGCAKTPHNMGKNDRGERFDDLELICRDGGRVDRFMRNAEAAPVRDLTRGVAPPTETHAVGILQWPERKTP